MMMMMMTMMMMMMMMVVVVVVVVVISSRGLLGCEMPLYLNLKVHLVRIDCFYTEIISWCKVLEK